MKITNLLLNFRGALEAMVPHAEKVGMPWRRPKAYDEWDEIASTLFKQLVVYPLQWSLPDNQREQFNLPDYDLLRQEYAGLSTIEVKSPSLGEGRWMFHAFGTVKSPFDSVEAMLLDEKSRPLKSNFEICPILETQFQLNFLNRTGKSTMLDRVTISD